MKSLRGPRLVGMVEMHRHPLAPTPCLKVTMTQTVFSLVWGGVGLGGKGQRKLNWPVTAKGLKSVNKYGE